MPYRYNNSYIRTLFNGSLSTTVNTTIFDWPFECASFTYTINQTPIPTALQPKGRLLQAAERLYNFRIQGIWNGFVFYDRALTHRRGMFVLEEGECNAMILAHEQSLIFNTLPTPKFRLVHPVSVPITVQSYRIGYRV
jgi:hypothetical protein